MGNLEFGYLTIVGAIGAAEALLGRERERRDRLKGLVNAYNQRFGRGRLPPQRRKIVREHSTNPDPLDDLRRLVGASYVGTQN